MKQNQDDEKKRKTKSGLVDGTRLSRYKVNSRIFKHRNQAKKGKNYFVSILMDASGSMRGTKDKICLETVITLCDSLNEIPGMHFEIVGFNTIEVKYKDYYDKYDSKLIREQYQQQFRGYCHIGYNKTTRDTIFRLETDTMHKENPGYVFNHYDSVSGENHDTISVFNSLKRIQERGGRKILLIFSDGAPTLGNTPKGLFEGVSVEGSKDLLKLYLDFGVGESLVEVVRKKPKDVDILSIGIEDSNVKRFYPNYIIVKEVSELYEKTIKELNKFFKKD